MASIQELILKYHRTGEKSKAKWLETIDEKVPPSFRERIKKDDMSVRRELIFPEWVTWDLLKQWIAEKEVADETESEEELPKVVDIEKLILKYQRTGESAKAKWLETMHEKIPPSFKERIKKDDKKILNELILPSWVTWDILRSWAESE